MVNDLVLVDVEGARFLAIIALTTEQVVTISDSAATGRVIAATDSADVAAAVRLRNAVALELARAELGPDVPVLAASWSADSGRVTLALDRSAAELPGIVEKLEPRYRAEVRCSAERRRSVRVRL